MPCVFIASLQGVSRFLCHSHQTSASKRLQISLMNDCLLLLFQLGDIQSLWHFLALWSSYRLNAQAEFREIIDGRLAFSLRYILVFILYFQ